jgi:hypothetical protein
MADACRDLIAWRKATQLAVEIYRVTQKFPKDELYGLTSQMRRAAVSVASNIAGDATPARNLRSFSTAPGVPSSNSKPNCSLHENCNISNPSHSAEWKSERTSWAES